MTEYVRSTRLLRCTRAAATATAADTLLLPSTCTRCSALLQYDDIPVETSGREVPEPVEEFTEELLGPALLRNVDLAKFSRPTPVQKYSIPMGAAGRDIMACAQTGSGKTGGFLFPTIMSLLEKGARAPPGGAPSRLQFPSAVILSPTRELTTQIYDEARRFCYRTGIRPVVVYGGQPFGEQAREVSKGCDLLVATPGRLIDFLDRGRIALDCVQFLVLDEADRMLDMGFEPQIRRIVQDQGMPVDTRQTFMFSATFPNEIQQMATDFMRDYIFLAVGRVGGAAQDITQVVELVEDRDKPMQLMRHLNTVTEGLIVVFVERKASADQLEWELTREGYPATSIHGDRDQWQREEALKSFKDGRTPILVATDVAARGLDINNVGHVFNFDMPNNIDDYVHRIGRTGRAGNTGKAVSFVNARNSAIVGGLIDLLQEAEQEVPNFLPRLMSSRGGGRGGRGGGRRGGRGGRGGSNFGARDMRSGMASTVHNVRGSEGGRSGGSSGGARFGAGRRAAGASAW